MDNLTISTYIIHLKKTESSLKHIQNEFANKKEFDTIIVDAVGNPASPINLWNSIVQAVSMADEQEEDVIVVCKDDHCFTAEYNKKEFFDTVIKAYSLSTDILLGGIRDGFSNIVVVDEQMLWIDSFLGTQFMVIYKSLFSEILDTTFDESDIVDKKLSHLSANKLLMYPMISVQKESGRTDIESVGPTQKNEGNPSAISVAKLDRLYRKHFLLKDKFYN